jgi:hypothetical protein
LLLSYLFIWFVYLTALSDLSIGLSVLWLAYLFTWLVYLISRLVYLNPLKVCLSLLLIYLILQLLYLLFYGKTSFIEKERNVNIFYFSIKKLI